MYVSHAFRSSITLLAGSEVDSELDRVINSLETAHKSDQHAREGREGGRGGHGSDTSYEDPRKDDPRRRGGSPERGGGGGGGGGVGGGGGGGVGFGGITGVDLRGLSRRQRRGESACKHAKSCGHVTCPMHASVAPCRPVTWSSAHLVCMLVESAYMHACCCVKWSCMATI